MKRAVSVEIIVSKIFLIRGKKVMLGNDLAKLYGVKTMVLMQAVKRNKDRFPGDFMYQLTRQEVANLKSQIVISSWGGRRYLPYVFTQEGVAMLSSVLNSKRAIKVNIQIMRAFVKLKELLLTHKDLAIKIEALERKCSNHDEKIMAIFEAIKQLLQPPAEEKKIAGFRVDR
ncbi:MAG: ORF6N domain-containing protein [Candidatus Omnitrophota bacterium]